MQVILLKDVARLGRRGEVKEVPSGHAQNFLIPRKLAVPATPENLKRAIAEKEKHAEIAEHTEASFTKALETLAATPVELAVSANEQGHLFRGVKAEDIHTRLEELKTAVPLTAIDLPHPIKALGTHEVRLVMGKKEGTLTLTLVNK